MLVKTKICGTTSPADARLAHEAGADFLGVILHHPASPRHVSLAVAREIRASVADGVAIELVALSVNQSLDTLLEIVDNLQPYALQLHGDESPELVSLLVGRVRVWKAISGDENALFEGARRFTEAGAAAIVVDAREVSAQGIVYGGTGQLADWNAARGLVEAGFRVVLAGGLSPENVGRAIETVRPWAVDVVSGVEATKGIKAASKVRDFVKESQLGNAVDVSSRRFSVGP